MTEHEELALELTQVASALVDEGYAESARPVRRAAALLREASPQWVPVAERPWERPNWCDSEGRCWWLTMDQSWPCIYLMKPNSTLATDSATYALQHWAILIPSPTENINGSTNR